MSPSSGSLTSYASLHPRPSFWQRVKSNPIVRGAFSVGTLGTILHTGVAVTSAGIFNAAASAQFDVLSVAKYSAAVSAGVHIIAGGFVGKWLKKHPDYNSHYRPVVVKPWAIMAVSALGCALGARYLIIPQSGSAEANDDSIILGLGCFVYSMTAMPQVASHLSNRAAEWIRPLPNSLSLNAPSDGG